MVVQALFKSSATQGPGYSFFAVYQASKASGRLDELADTQEALDNLTSSNMANVGVVYPAGLAAFLLGTALLGG